MHRYLVDTHIHLCDPLFADDMQGILARVRQCGVSALIAVAKTMQDARKNVELARHSPGKRFGRRLQRIHAACMERLRKLCREREVLWAEREPGS